MDREELKKMLDDMLMMLDKNGALMEMEEGTVAAMARVELLNFLLCLLAQEGDITEEEAAFVGEMFALCRDAGIHTCLDTSGCVLNDEVKAALSVTDRVLLDLKYTTDGDYRQYVGTSLHKVLDFLDYLDARGIPTTLRQVIVPTLNDTAQHITALRDIAAAHPCVDGVELLPFRKICQVKYDEMGLPFPFAHLLEPTAEKMAELNALLR